MNVTRSDLIKALRECVDLATGTGPISVDSFNNAKTILDQVDAESPDAPDALDAVERPSETGDQIIEGHPAFGVIRVYQAATDGLTLFGADDPVYEHRVLEIWSAETVHEPDNQFVASRRSLVQVALTTEQFSSILITDKGTLCTIQGLEGKSVPKIKPKPPSAPAVVNEHALQTIDALIQKMPTLLHGAPNRTVDEITSAIQQLRVEIGGSRSEIPKPIESNRARIRRERKDRAQRKRRGDRPADRKIP